jgi:hypothetical protein
MGFESPLEHQRKTVEIQAKALIFNGFCYFKVERF